MKKITLMIAALAATISMSAQNPFVNGMVFSSVTTACSGDGAGNCDPENSDIALTSEIAMNSSENVDEMIISDITGGLYQQIYGAMAGNRTIVAIDSENMTLTVTDAPDNVYGGDVFNATGSYTVDGGGNVNSFTLTWSNGYGDQGTSDFTYESTSTEVPGIATNPTPENGATDVEVDGTVDDNGNTNFVDFSFDAPENTGDSDILGYDLFLAGPEDTQLQYGGRISVTEGVRFQNMELDATYQWAIVPVNAAGSANAENVEVWSFTTGTLGVNDYEVSGFSYYNTLSSLELRADQQIDNVRLFNLLGQQVASQEINNTTGSVNIANLTAGVYLAQIQVGGKTQTVKFAKK